MNLRKYLKVYKKFLHTSLASELEYKTNIVVDLITAILSLVGSIFLLSIFFQNNGYIGGWKFEQALIIQRICILKPLLIFVSLPDSKFAGKSIRYGKGVK